MMPCSQPAWFRFFTMIKPTSLKKLSKPCLPAARAYLEFTNRGEKALSVFSHLNTFIEDAKLPIILGVGSVIDAPTAALYIAHGANFIVGPLFNPEVARLCNRRKIAYFPGCATVAEISTAEEAGVEIVKVFPGETVGGPNFIKAVLGPSALVAPDADRRRRCHPRIGAELAQSRRLLCGSGQQPDPQRLGICRQLPGHSRNHAGHPAVGCRSQKITGGFMAVIYGHRCIYHRRQSLADRFIRQSAWHRQHRTAVFHTASVVE